MRLLAPYVLHRGQVKRWASVPRINWSHPLARGLVLYGYDTGTGTVIDLVSGGIGKHTGTSTPNGSSKFGNGINYPGAGVTGAVELPNTNIGSVFAAAPYSFASAWFMTAAPVVSDGFGTFPFCVGDSAAGHNGLAFDLNSSGSVPAQVDYVYGDSGASVVATTNSINAFHTALGVALTSTSSNSYFDGVSIGTSATNTVLADSPVQALFNEYLIGGGSTGNGVQGFIYYGAIWNRVLSASEALQLHLDPYCFLIYPQDEMWARRIGVAAGGTVALTGAGMTSAAGAFGQTVAKGITGAGMTSAAGTISAGNALSVALTGAAASSAAGTLAESVAKALTGAAMTAAAQGVDETVVVLASSATAMVASAGSLSVTAHVNLTGAGAASAPGTFTDAIVRALSGAGASISAGTLADAIAVVLSGAAANSAAGVFVESIIKALTGAAANSAAGTLSTSTSSGGTVSLTGAQAVSAAGSFADAISATLPGASAGMGAGIISASNALSLAIAGASANALAGSFSQGEQALLPGAAIAALAGLIQQPGHVGLFGAFAQASAGILTVLAVVDFIPSPRVVLVGAEVRLAAAIESAREVIAPTEGRSDTPQGP